MTEIVVVQVRSSLPGAQQLVRHASASDGDGVRQRDRHRSAHPRGSLRHAGWTHIRDRR